MGLELTVMAVVGMLIGIPVVGMMVHSTLKPRPCESLPPILSRIIDNQDRITERIIDTQCEIIESQKLILHYLDLLERRQRSD